MKGRVPVEANIQISKPTKQSRDPDFDNSLDIPLTCTYNPPACRKGRHLLDIIQSRRWDLAILPNS